MGSEAPSWADQWGSGSYGVEDDEKAVTKKGSSKKMAEVKAATSAGFVKAKSVAAVGAQKVKFGTSVSIKWVKNQYQKKGSPNDSKYAFVFHVDSLKVFPCETVEGLF